MKGQVFVAGLLLLTVHSSRVEIDIWQHTLLRTALTPGTNHSKTAGRSFSFTLATNASIPRISRPVTFNSRANGCFVEISFDPNCFGALMQGASLTRAKFTEGEDIWSAKQYYKIAW